VVRYETGYRLDDDPGLIIHIIRGVYGERGSVGVSLVKIRFLITAHHTQHAGVVPQTLCKAWVSGIEVH
jgi:hypothetical protein